MRTCQHTMRTGQVVQLVLIVSMGVFLGQSLLLSSRVWDATATAAAAAAEQQLIPSRINDRQKEQQQQLKCQRLQEEHAAQTKLVEELQAQLAEAKDALQNAQTQQQTPSKEGAQSNDNSANATINDSHNSTTTNTTNTHSPDWIPPASIQDFIHGMGRVHRRDFAETFDTGHGLDPDWGTGQEVLMLYSSPKAFPNHWKHNNNTPRPPRNSSVMSAYEATENCENVRVLHVPKRRKHQPYAEPQCLALVGNWETHHVPRFVRKGKKKPRFDHTFAYRGSKSIPTTAMAQAALEELAHYLAIFPQVVERLKPIAARVAKVLPTHQQEQQSSKKKKKQSTINPQGTIIIMVANQGHAMFLTNFVCAAQSRGLSIENILMFATDQAMYDMAQDLGFTVFYDAELFGNIPTTAAVNYTDINYGKMMVSKVYVAHLISHLGYDFLFQDTDLVWYKDPLEYFEHHAKAGFDMYFQHDGWHHPERFAPLAANTGFYFVRHNPRTEHFFSMLSRMVDVIYMDKSHQSAVALLANDQMVQRGLKVKVLADEDKYFQTGYHFHNFKSLMYQSIDGRFEPYLFHANWLAGADKQPVMEAIRNWFLPPTCAGNKIKDLLNANSNLTSQCCLASPIISNSSNKFYLPRLKN